MNIPVKDAIVKQEKEEKEEVEKESFELSPLTEQEIEKKRKSKHYQMIYAYVTTGMTNKELGNTYDISEAHIMHMKRTTLWKNEEELLRSSIRRDMQVKIDVMVPLAINAITDAMIGPNSSAATRLTAASKALEVAEFGKTRDKTPQEGEKANTLTLNLTRPGWDQDGEGKGDTINIQVNLDK